MSTEHQELEDRIQEVAEEIAELVGDGGLTLACAESLTSGAIASALGAAPSSADWFRGGVVAYSSEVKQTVLDVAPGPVVTASCADSMACAVRRLLGADLAVSVTGVGGPDPEEGEPAGTVYFGIADSGGSEVELRRFDGDPPAIVKETTLHALTLLLKRLR